MSPAFPKTLPDFRAAFPDDAACRRYLIESRWADGFRCPGCGGGAAWELARLRFLCRRCRRETSVTAGTILDHTRLPLVTWFGAAYLVATTPGLNALELGRLLGLSSRETTWTVMSRLRRSMSSWTRIPNPSGGLKRGAGRATRAADGATSRFKRWLLATYHKPPTDYRPYLDEFCFRSEFRGDPATAFETLLGLAVTGRERDLTPVAVEPPEMTHATATMPSRERRVAARRAMLAFTARRQRPGSGSMLDELMKGRRPTMEWWSKAAGVIQGKDIKIAVTGAVAANAYMPPRQTADLDLALQIADLDEAGRALKAAGWTFLGNLGLYEDLRGTAWKLGRDELDLIGIPGTWGHAAIAGAQDNKRVRRLPTLTLPYVVVMKLISARPQDSADISRMLGPASEETLDAVRAVVKRWRPAEVEDLEQMIVAGQLEFGPTKK